MVGEMCVLVLIGERGDSVPDRVYPFNHFQVSEPFSVHLEPDQQFAKHMR